MGPGYAMAEHDSKERIVPFTHETAKRRYLDYHNDIRVELSDCILANKRTMIGQQISLPRSYIVAYNPPGVRRYVKRSRQHVMLDIAKRQAVLPAARSNQDSAILIPTVQNHSPITVLDSSIRTAHAWDAPLVRHGVHKAPWQHH